MLKEGSLTGIHKRFTNLKHLSPLTSLTSLIIPSPRNYHSITMEQSFHHYGII